MDGVMCLLAENDLFSGWFPERDRERGLPQVYLRGCSVQTPARHTGHVTSDVAFYPLHRCACMRIWVALELSGMYLSLSTEVRSFVRRYEVAVFQGT